MTRDRTADTRAATAARVERSDFKRSVKAGRIPLAEALEHPIAQRMLIAELIGALPFRAVPKRSRAGVRMAASSAHRVCKAAAVDGLARVATLQPYQRRALGEAYADFHRPEDR